MIPLVEQVRGHSLTDVFKTKGFEELWPARKDFMLSLMNNARAPTRRDIIDLGQHLSAAFRLASTTRRSNEVLSQSGSTWEALVVWYMNLCLAGTNAVCIRGGGLCPSPIKDAMAVSFENTILRSEPDVLVISCKDLGRESQAESRKEILHQFSTIIGEHFGSVGVANLLCKTNWNDNAQIPMLWNMLYMQARNGGAAAGRGFSIGQNGHRLSDLGYFGYSFVTVPTQTKGVEGFKPTNLEVLRAKTMSAGNYWGHATSTGVCRSLAEFFNPFADYPAIFPNASEIGKHAAKAVQGGSPSILRFP